ncbi:MAG: hypothetical protein RL250_1595 [Verrucomicrobiota bacterium]
MLSVDPAPRRWLSRRLLVLAASALSLAAARAQDAEKLTYDDHVRPLLENKCFSCHNPDKKKGGLDLTSYAALLNGGGGGAVVDAGNPAGSRLWTCSSKKEEPFMPPEGAPLEAKDLTLLSRWIAGGLLQAKGSVARKSSQPKVDLAFNASAGKPTGPVARPEHVLLEPVIVTPRTTAVTAMAASPWTSLLAVAAPKQILLYDTESRELAGILPYPEGYARSLRFSANGSLLVMGGGRGGKSGHAVVWDVRTGRRVTEVGKEFDQVMSADITPDHRKVALATNTKKVKCYDTATGELLYTIAKHTDWVTGADFSPDGILLATADRNGNVMVWEAENGGEFYNLGQHKGAVTDLAWRADSNVLASCGADGTITTWEMKTGKRVASWSHHGGNVQTVAFTPDGRLLSAGADGTCALWTIDGKRLEHALGTRQADVVSKLVTLADGKVFVTGNWLGEVRFFEVASGRELTQVPTNPPRLADRLAAAEKQLAALQAKAVTAPADAQAAAAKLRAAEATHAPLLAASVEVMRKLEAVDARYQPAAKELEALRAVLYKSTDEKAKAGLTAKVKAATEALAPAKTERRALLEAAAKESLDLAWIARRLADLQTNVKNAEGGLSYADKQLAKAVDEPARTLARKQRDINAAAVESARGQVAALQAREGVVKAQLAAFDRLKTEAAAAEAFARQSAAQVAGAAQRVAFLRAAEFNVGVLSEREKLAKLEADIADALAARADNEKALALAGERLEPARRQAAERAEGLPGAEAEVVRLQGEFAALDRALGPLRLAEAAAAAKVEAQARLVAEAEANLTEHLKRRDAEVAAAKTAIEDYGRAIRPTRLRLADLTAQLDAATKQMKELRSAQETAARDLDAANAAGVAAQAALQEANRSLTGAKAAAELAAATQAEATAALASAGSFRGFLTFRRAAHQAEAEAALAAATAVARRSQAAVVAAQAAVPRAQAELARRANAVAELGRKQAELAAALAKLEPGIAPLTKESADLTKTRAAQLKEYARLQAVPAAVEKDFEAKAVPFREKVQAAKAGLPALEAPLAAVRAELATALKPVDAKRAEVAAASQRLESARREAVAAAKAHAALAREIPDRNRARDELARTLDELQPQVAPLKAKVQADEARYLAMLPKQ